MGKQPRTLRGKVVAITGGARGIGARTAAALAREGTTVVIGDLDRPLAERTAAEIGGDVHALHLDVTDTDGFTAFLDTVERDHGRLDVLVNNAGIMPLSAVQDEDDTSTRTQLEINLHAVIHGTKEAVRRMLARGSGHIVNVASMAGKSGFPGGATYCATKHGVVGFSESVHLQLRGTGVNVSCVMPAVVRTELASGLGESKTLKPVSPDDVAAAIVAALRVPRFDVYVPKSLDAVGRITRLFPRSIGERIARAFGGDTVLFAGVGAPARHEYEARAGASAPGAEEHRRSVS